MDILEYLQADHDALRELIIELNVADENSPAEAQAYSALVKLFNAQSRTQEAVLLPLAELASPLRELIYRSAERNRGAQDVEAMIECCTNKTTWRSSVNIYCEILQTRTQRDMRELFPVMYDYLSTKEREKLARAYKKARGFGKEEIPDKDWRKIWEAIFNRAG